MNWQRPILRSQHLAAAVTCVTVLIMLTPLRRGPESAGPRQAGWMPLFQLGGLVDSAAFHRLEMSPSRHQAGDAPMIRLPGVLNKLPPP